MDMIYCAGDGKVLAEIALEEEFLYGSNSDDIREIPRCNGFIDVKARYSSKIFKQLRLWKKSN